jgi:hypothetical protein|tara:strand:+ start:1638 stop:2612 length:975 start_codon:yes stop_codon:yes gene_type:complete
MATVIYTIQDFDNIKWSDSTFTLPQETTDLINLLTQQVGAPTYVKTPSFSNKNSTINNDKNSYRKKKRRNEEVNTPDDWQSLRSFQKTEFVKKEGIEKEIDGIRALINKLTDKTYDKIIEKLTTILDEIKDNENCDDIYIDKIGHSIFTMATSNKFNSNVYARLANELQTKYEFMTNIVDNNINEFMKLFEDMEFVSPEVDYNKFCEMNIVNEKRRAMSLFLTSLYKNNVITLDFVFDKIISIQNMIMEEETMLNESKYMEVNELSENLYIFLTSIPYSTLVSYSGWSQIMDNLLQIKNIDTKKFMGISPKSKFKHMDILDKLK